MYNLSKIELENLINKSYESRKKILLMMKSGSIHLGGALSSIDIITVLYNKVLNHNPKKPKWNSRDRFILSAGHKGVAIYVVLQDQGYFSEEILWTFNKFKSPIPEHPDEKTIPGIEFPTGSLGHGLSAGCGMALAAKIDSSNYKVFVLLGDGECAEGSVWEAAMAAAHYKLDNLIAVIDRNGLQVNGPTKEIMNTSSLEDKFLTFGWEVKTIDGHDLNEIYKSLIKVPYVQNKPSCIVANTIKSKGIAFAEDDFTYHHCHLDNDAIDKALIEIEKARKKELLKIGKS